MTYELVVRGLICAGPDCANPVQVRLLDIPRPVVPTRVYCSRECFRAAHPTDT